MSRPTLPPLLLEQLVSVVVVVGAVAVSVVVVVEVLLLIFVVVANLKESYWGEIRRAYRVKKANTHFTIDFDDGGVRWHVPEKVIIASTTVCSFVPITAV